MQQPRSESYALVVGIENYWDKRLKEVDYAENDANDIYQILVEAPFGKYPRENVQKLLTHEGTKSNLARAIEQLFSRVTKMDTVFFYFAGHGRQSETGGYFLPYDFQETEGVVLEDKAYNFSFLHRKLKAHQPRNFIFFIDCCYSGMAIEQIDPSYGLHFRGNTGNMNDQVKLRDGHFGELLKGWESEGGCRSTFSSCQRDEQAAAHDELRHGLFTYFLIKGLRGEADLNSDGRVDVNELWAYISNQMSSYCKQMNVYQTPMEEGRLSGRFFLPSWGKILSSEGMKVSSCPICGRRNEERETFHCKVCNRDYLCLIHQVKGSWVCEECEQEKKKRELAIELDIITPSKAKKQSTYLDPYTGIEFVHVKGGEYEMGDMFGDGTEDEKPVHKVIVNDFCIGKYLVNQGQWIRVMNEFVPIPLRENYPVEAVSWKHVQQFIDRLNQRTDKNYRLPTEAEWEYAARSGGKREKWAGTSDESELGEYAWYHANSGDMSHSVGQRQPNSIGLYDMSGNVWEWCGDWYADDYYKRSPSNNPKGPELGKERVLRGGAEGSTAKYVRVSCRNSHEPSLFPARPIGFRLVLPPR